ncbi:hypothetical protein Hanom_Chr14g01336881 [Helianthus anomalus]
MTDPLHENGISFRDALKHVPTHMLHTGITSGILDHMWQIKIDALDGRVFGDDHAQAGAGPSPHIHQGAEVVEAVIDIQDLFHGHGGVIKHAGVENLVESGVFPVILKGRHSVCLVERDSTIQHCIFQMVPNITSHHSLIHPFRCFTNNIYTLILIIDNHIYHLLLIDHFVKLITKWPA